MSWCPGSSAVPARWDLSIVLEGLSDAPFGVSLREASDSLGGSTSSYNLFFRE